MKATQRWVQSKVPSKPSDRTKPPINETFGPTFPLHAIRSPSSHPEDFLAAYTAVTPAKGEFMRMRGRIEIKSAK